MLSVRLPPAVEQELLSYCNEKKLTKSQVVQEALTQWLRHARSRGRPVPPDLSFLAPDDPLRRYIGSVKSGPSTDEWMAITRGEDWNRP